MELLIGSAPIPSTIKELAKCLLYTKRIYGGIKYLRNKKKAVSEKEKDNTG